MTTTLAYSATLGQHGMIFQGGYDRNMLLLVPKVALSPPRYSNGCLEHCQNQHSFVLIAEGQ